MQASERAQLLSNVGTLYRRLGDAVKALETYRQAQGLYAQEHLSDGEIHVLQNIGIARALDLHDLNGAVAEFSRALTLAQAGSNRREAALAHLFRGEAFYRMGRASYAARDFSSALAEARAIGGAEEQWTALYGLGRIERDTKDAAGGSARALATFRQAIEIVESLRTGLGDSPLKTEFLANKRGLYDAAIDLMLRNPACRLQELFALLEKARSRNLQDALRAPIPGIASVQARLAPGSMLLEYWLGPGRRRSVLDHTTRQRAIRRACFLHPMPPGLHEVAAALERERSRLGRPLHSLGTARLLDGVRTDGVTQLLIVPDDAPWPGNSVRSTRWRIRSPPLRRQLSPLCTAHCSCVRPIPGASCHGSAACSHSVTRLWIPPPPFPMKSDGRRCPIPPVNSDPSAVSCPVPLRSTRAATITNDICSVGGWLQCRCCTSARMRPWISPNRTAPGFSSHPKPASPLHNICSVPRSSPFPCTAPIWSHFPLAIRNVESS